MISLYSSLASEVNELEMLLAGMPTENILDRKSLEARLAKVQRQLAELNATSESPVDLSGKTETKFEELS